MSLQIVDPFKGKTKIFETMEHKHQHGIPMDSTDPDCLKCKFTRQENSIPKKRFIIKDRKGNDVNIVKITLHRGRFDDCMGWSF